MITGGFSAAELDAEGIADEGDTDSYPQPDFGDEADTPHHCDHCGEFLRNGLTSDGFAYVREAIREHLTNGRGDRDVLTQWADFYNLPFSLIVGDDE